MIYDDVITRLVELHDHIQAPAAAPGADIVRGRRMLRRRRAAVVGAAAVAVVAVLGITAVVTGGPQTGGRTEPVQPGPSQGPTATSSASPSTDDEWPPERIRAEGSPDEERVTEPGITTRAYVVCDGPRSVCKSDPPLRVPYEHAALEVTQDGRSALFGLGASGEYAAQSFDADSVFVMDDPDNNWGEPLRLRFRVLGADGTEVLLELLDEPAPAVPGAGVFVVDFDAAIGGFGSGYGGEFVYLVDLREGTMQPLDVPNRAGPEGYFSRYWGPNVDEFLWFVNPDCEVGWATDGTFEQRRLDCGEGRRRPAYIHDEGFPDGWLQPGRMAMVEPHADRLFLHVSLDYGSTWQRIPLSDDDAIPDALRELG